MSTDMEKFEVDFSWPKLHIVLRVLTSDSDNKFFIQKYVENDFVD